MENLAKFIQRCPLLLPTDDDELKTTEVRQIYKPDELAGLLQCVKDMTVLAGIGDTDWEAEVLTDVKEFFQNPKISTLCLYLSEDNLQSCLGFPAVPVQQLTYFIRDPMQVFFLYNFREEVQFGTINNTVQEHILDMCRDTFAPIFYKIQNWPDSVEGPLLVVLVVPRYVHDKWAGKGAMKGVASRTALGDPAEPAYEFAKSNHPSIQILRCENIILDQKTKKTTTYVRVDFYTNLETFLCNLTDLTYKLLGLTVMYVPSMAAELTVEAAASDKELVKRLEAVVVHWTTQVRIALSDQDQISPERLLRMEDQFEFWRYRYNNLSGLHQQIQDQRIQHIIDILLTKNSTYIRQFVGFEDEISQRIDEAMSNIEYLDILKDPITDLNNSTRPSDMIIQLPRLIHLLRTIWTQSAFYSSKDRITGLFQTLSNQIITILRDFIVLKNIFAGFAKQGIDLSRNCILVCKEYQRIYEEVSMMIQTFKNVALYVFHSVILVDIRYTQGDGRNKVIIIFLEEKTEESVGFLCDSIAEVEEVARVVDREVESDGWVRGRKWRRITLLPIPSRVPRAYLPTREKPKSVLLRPFLGPIILSPRHANLVANVYKEKEDDDKVPWDLDEELIFQHINIFITRCYNLIEICQAMRDFARLENTENIPKPKFSGTKGEEYETICQKIENMFKAALRKVKHQSQKILNVQEAHWNDDLFRFRNDVKDLEIIIKNLADDVFAKINNVCEGIQQLRAFLTYLDRPSLGSLFQQKVLMLWTMFKDDIQETKKELVEEREEYQAISEYYAGRALNFWLKLRYLKSTRDLLNESKWMPACEIASQVMGQYNLVSKSIYDLMGDFRQKWLHSIGDNPCNRLDRYLMRHSIAKPGLIECNMDPTILNLCREAEHWINLKFDLPVHVRLIYSKWEDILYVYESVLSVTLAFNRIVEALSTVEQDLFRQLIHLLDRKINPGLNKLTWNTEHIDAYIDDCFKQTANLQEFLDVYKRANAEILKTAEEICNLPLIRIKPNQTYTLQEFRQEFLQTRYSAPPWQDDCYIFQRVCVLPLEGLEIDLTTIYINIYTIHCILLSSYRDAVATIIYEKYHLVIECILVIYEGLEEVIDNSLAQWKLYLQNLDTVLEEAFKQCLKHSLTILYKALHGDGTAPPAPLFLVQADLIEKKIRLQPSIKDMADTIGRTLDDLLEPIKNLKRLIDKFKILDTSFVPFWRVYKNDDELENLQKMLNFEADRCFDEVENYVRIWRPFKEIWEINRDLYMHRYEKRQPNVESFTQEINKYIEEAENVLMQETVIPVHFLNVHSDRLKGAIIEQCSIWQSKLTSLLYRLTDSRIDQFYHYIADSSQNKLGKSPEEMHVNSFVCRIMKEPTDLISMQFALQLFERLTAEIPGKEEEFPKIQEQYETLEKFQVPLTFEFRRKYKDIDRSWNAYLKLIASSDVILQEKKCENLIHWSTTGGVQKDIGEEYENLSARYLLVNW
ncbi:dynein axonemal heavy chain 2-like [Prorops nasuta]|uniref:dynein axonemal heavy chain 2-like n=1 Tax=Prorops nasuta TaxID=863751 RepID=UPI0034CE4DEB